MKKYSKSFVVAAVLCCVLIFTCANAFAQDITINENIENSEIRPYDFLLGMTTVLVDNTPLRSSKTDNSTDLGPCKAGDLVYIYNDNSDEIWANVYAARLGKYGYIRLVNLDLDNMEPASIDY
ncbi:MAG TPA: hypothetical protein DEF85_07650 [Clostridiaceae bacterium]|jgi:hypothetical protein|nr:hypothetical protein [Clostridiaceae bacterium]HBX48749.1 hypothetical protein [Clostridiaceae bacterium]